MESRSSLHPLCQTEREPDHLRPGHVLYPLVTGTSTAVLGFQTKRSDFHCRGQDSTSFAKCHR